jgi:hypothetical protein
LLHNCSSLAVSDFPEAPEPYYACLEFELSITMRRVIPFIFLSVITPMSGAKAFLFNQVSYFPPIVGGVTLDTDLTTDFGDTWETVIVIPGGFVKDTWSSEDESYYLNLGGVAGAGLFRLTYTMWLTQDGNKIAGTEKSWISPLIVPALPGFGKTLNGSTDVELTDTVLKFNDIHAKIQITGDPLGVQTITWEKATLGVDADIAQVPAPLPIFGVGVAFNTARRLRRRRNQIKSISI